MADVVINSQDQLVAAGKRLERLLGGNNGKNGPSSSKDNKSATAKGGNSNKSNSEKKAAVVEAATTMIHSNPSKIVKRWLGTSSGISGKMTLSDVSYAASKLLNPTGSSATGRDILVQLSPPLEQMQTDENNVDKNEKDRVALLEASAREFEAYLFTLAIRILWSEGESSMQQALDLSIKGIQIVTLHIEELEAKPNNFTGIGAGSATGLFPLLARLYRYQGLVTESLCGDIGGSILVQHGRREQLAHAHRMAVMRRDVDTQATLLNLMLRELLVADQGVCCRLSTFNFMFTTVSLVPRPNSKIAVMLPIY